MESAIAFSPPNRAFRGSDVVALLWVAFCSIMIFQFRGLIPVHPYAMAFAKFFCLATFGECLRHRILEGTWHVSKLPIRAVVWGVFGMWLCVAFPFIDTGVEGVVHKSMWSSAVPHPLSVGLWINLLIGFGPFFMTVHYIVDQIIDHGWMWPWQALAMPSFLPWVRRMICSVFIFWIPAQTVTFFLPPEVRLIVAAYLSVALGAMLAVQGTIERHRAS